MRKELHRCELGETMEGNGRGFVLHASRAAGPVAVVEIEAFALEYECADAILGQKS